MVFDSFRTDKLHPQDSVTFLNHGAFGATLKSSLESKRQWAEYIERQPVRFFDRRSVAVSF